MAAQFDAIVIGSGITGGWAAKELAEKGFKTLLLERGRKVEHAVDYQGEHRPKWDYPFRGQVDRKTSERDYFIQNRFGWFTAQNQQFWNNDRLNPYVLDEDKPFHWVRAGVLGGRSLLWSRQCYRWSDLDFEANARDGHGIDWPIRYEDIRPWYDHVEEVVGISGEKLGLPQLPDGRFQPPMEMNVVEKHFRKSVEEQFPGRTATIGRVAVLTQPKNGRHACHYCGPCSNGCSARAYFSSLTVTLPLAQATGNLSTRTDAVVEGLDHDPQSGKVSGVRFIDANTGQRETATGRVVFLCASAIASAQIMLNSKSEVFPNGLANRSGALGRYVMDHTFATHVSGIIPGFLDKMEYGFRPNGVYIPRFRNLEGQDGDADFVRGYGYQGGVHRMTWQQVYRDIPGFGAEYKKALHDPGPWRIGFSGFGEILPDKRNVMFLDEKQKDRFGIPQVRFDVAYRENEKRMIADIMKQGEAMLAAAGATDIRSGPGPMIMGRGVHEMGTARMGHDPAESVLNGWNQAHDVKNLFVTDGACMTSGSCVNPSITYMAITARAANHAADLMQQGQL
jgi:choline dehydrogenase-like flavoprotein